MYRIRTPLSRARGGATEAGRGRWRPTGRRLETWPGGAAGFVRAIPVVLVALCACSAATGLPIGADPLRASALGASSHPAPAGPLPLQDPSADPVSWAATLAPPNPLAPLNVDGTHHGWATQALRSLDEELVSSPELLLTQGTEGAQRADQGRVSALLSPQGLRDALLASPLGQEVLLLALEVFTPAIDPQGRIHVSIFGHGELILPTGQSDEAMPRAYEAGGLAEEDALVVLSEQGLPVALEGRLTVKDFVDLYAKKALGFLVHPLTILLAGLGAVGYLSVRYALERRKHRPRKAHRPHLHMHRHRRRHHRHRSSLRPRLHPSP